MNSAHTELIVSGGPGTDPPAGTIVHPSGLPRRIPGAALKAVRDAGVLPLIETEPVLLYRCIKRFQARLSPPPAADEEHDADTAADRHDVAGRSGDPFCGPDGVDT